MDVQCTPNITEMIRTSQFERDKYVLNDFDSFERSSTGEKYTFCKFVQNFNTNNLFVGVGE